MQQMNYLFFLTKNWARTRTAVAGGSTAGTSAIVVNEVDSIQIAYTMGGMTLGMAKVEETNIDFGSTSDDKTVLSVAVSF